MGIEFVPGKEHTNQFTHGIRDYVIRIKFHKKPTDQTVLT